MKKGDLNTIPIAMVMKTNGISKDKNGLSLKKMTISKNIQTNLEQTTQQQKN